MPRRSSTVFILDDSVETALAELQLGDIDLADFNADPGDSFVMQSLPRRNKSRRPLVKGRPWESISTPMVKARSEAPFASASPEDMDLAHGTFYNKIPELDEVARLQYLALPNRCVSRPARDRPVQPVPSRLPAVGACSDLFISYSFNPVEHGEWVRQRLRECKTSSRRSASWVLSPQQIVDEIIIWYESWAKDAADAAVWAANGKRGRFKPHTKLWILPQLAFAKFSRGIVWDTAAYFAATPEQRPFIIIAPHDWEKAAPNPWDTTALSKWFDESGCEDHATMQDLHEVGVFLPFTGTMDSVFSPPAAGFYDKLEVGQAVTYEEIKEGKLSNPIMGPHYLPAKLSSRNVARICRAGVIKDRGTANLTGPNKLELTHHSVNAGYAMETDLENFPPLKLTCPNLIAFHIAIIAPACGVRLVICKNDWCVQQPYPPFAIQPVHS